MFCNVFVKGSKAFMTGGGLHMFYFSAVENRSICVFDRVRRKHKL